MQPFRFSLEKVLTVRSHQTQAAQQVYMQAQQAADKAHEQVLGARSDRRSHEERLLNRGAGGVTVREWLFLNEGLEGYRLVEQEAVRFHQERLARAADRRVELQEARRREKALEKLKERHREAHVELELAREQATLDEMAQTMQRRAEGGGGR